LPAGIEVQDLDLAGLLHDEQAARISRRRRDEKRGIEATRHAGCSDGRDVSLRAVGIEAVDQIPVRCATERVAAVVADDRVDCGHWNSVFTDLLDELLADIHGMTSSLT